MNSSSTLLPKHIGIIMDGNRRWAKKNGLAALRGHDYVAEKVIEPLVDHCIQQGISHITLWAFSTENWQRDQNEVEGLMDIFRKSFHKNSQRLFEKGVRLNAIGDLKRFPEDIQKGVEEWIEKSKENTAITVTFALNYGGRDEIVRAVNRYLDGNPGAEKITAEELNAHLDTGNMPDLDLLIRPGGEQRLSGFLPWQGVYAELYFADILMPDFTPAELQKALDEFSRRQRRFGK